MDDDSDSLDIELQETDDVGARMVLLSAIGFWPEFENFLDRQTWRNWLERQGALEIATDAERAMLVNPRPELDEDDLDRCRRAFDAIWSLAWTVQLHDEPGYSLSSEPLRRLIDELPGPNEPIEPFLDGIMLRPEDDLAIERERAEVWNWRLAAEVMARSSSGSEHSDMVEAIAEVVLECATNLVFADVDAVDFQIDGVHVRDLEADVLEAVLIASDEHLRSVNWVCGLTDWDSIHVPD